MQIYLEDIRTGKGENEWKKKQILKLRWPSQGFFFPRVQLEMRSHQDKETDCLYESLDQLEFSM